MDLNAATLTPNPTDILSLIPLIGNNPVASTNSSVSPAQSFSALLTEMTGPVQTSQPVVPAPTVAAPVVSAPSAPAPVAIAPADQPVAVAPVSVPAPQEISNIEPKGNEPQKAQKAQKVDPTETMSVPFVPAVPFVAIPSSSIAEPVEGKPSTTTKIDDGPKADVQIPVPQVPQPELERAFADVKKFEFKVQQDPAPAAKPAETENAPQQDPTKLPIAVVTTDPILTTQQQQLPPRVLAIQKVVAEAKPAERSKSAATASSDTTTTTSTAQPADLVRPVERMEQAAAANPIEVPNLPHLPVVRTVAMEVGDPGSEVTIRIQERGGDVAMQLNTGNDPLQQDLQSSVGSLVHALKQEQVQVSNIEVSRKSPIDKVRRMKESNNG